MRDITFTELLRFRKMSIRYVKLRGNTFALCRLGSARLRARVTCGFRKLLRANPVAPRRRTMYTLVDVAQRGRKYRRDASCEKGIPRARVGTPRRRGERAIAEKSPHTEIARGRGKRRRKRRFVHVRIMQKASEEKLDIRARMFR